MLSIILPTYNESGNLPELFRRITEVMGTRAHEIIVVDDDSPDKTWEVAEGLSKNVPTVRVLRRVGRRGLSSAVTEGFAMAKGDILLVMDADLQHDPQLINALADKIEQGADIAVASRYTEGGSVGDWVTGRRVLSKVATFLARKLPPVEVSDPMSGFFALSKKSYMPIANSLRPTGFKILLEVLAHLPRSSKAGEVPLHFQQRLSGESKLSMRVELQFIAQLVRILLGRIHLWLFAVVVIVILALLLPRVWRPRMLYLNPVVRNNVQITLQRVSDRQGWLLSDVTVHEVFGDHIVVRVRHHHRGPDETACFVVRYDDAPLMPCSAS